MTRLQADLALLMVSIIWGAAFLFQKTAMDHIGPYTYIAVRFGLSTLILLPLALREHKRGKTIPKSMHLELVFLCIAFIGGVVFQQAGIARTSVTNSGFLTGLYVLFVAVICRVIYKQPLSMLIYPAALLSVIGVGMLSGGVDLSHLNTGDILILCCAISFGFQVALIGRIMQKIKTPLQVCVLQYATVSLACVVLALLFEHNTLEQIWAARWAILYGGAISGGIAYTTQVIAQQYTPAADSAVIMSAESVFAAICGILWLGEKLTFAGMVGCLCIIIAILMVEFVPYMRRKPVMN